ncbi:MAG TPA: helix-turn-helix domain-containing protein [Megamonas hypermegale]|nr:helix-turn-helix domain-containing protein [Megamonas hypermegale]
MSTSYLSRIERGTYATGISLSTFMKIAKALDVDVSKLFEMDF